MAALGRQPQTQWMSQLQWTHSASDQAGGSCEHMCTLNTALTLGSRHAMTSGSVFRHVH